MFQRLGHRHLSMGYGGYSAKERERDESVGSWMIEIFVYQKSVICLKKKSP